jgi:hypothetical protein
MLMDGRTGSGCVGEVAEFGTKQRSGKLSLSNFHACGT